LFGLACRKSQVPGPGLRAQHPAGKYVGFGSVGDNLITARSIVIFHKGRKFPLTIRCASLTSNSTAQKLPTKTSCLMEPDDSGVARNALHTV
jgi:hypothetical protein